MCYGAGSLRDPFHNMRKALVLCLIVPAVALGPAAPGLAADSFTFYGSGFGHGLGMSQWGAYGLAQEGWTHKRVLTHFYSGTRVAQAGEPPKTLRIGLVQAKTKIRLTADAGKVDLRTTDPKTGTLVGSIPNGDTWTVRVVNQKYRVFDANGDRVDDVGGPNDDLYATYVPNDARVKVAEAGHTYNRGYLEFNIYNCDTSCAERVILPIAPQEYLYGLGEVPSSWPMQALEAQADAARTYAFTKAAAGQHRPDCNCALYATSADQVYAAWDKEGATDGDRWVKAVDNTDNEVVNYKGSMIQAFYMSSSGGYTENNENVWGGTPIGYLRGVCDPGDYTAANPSAVWTVTKSAADVTRALRLGVGTVTKFTDPVRGVSGRLISVTVVGDGGSATISGGTLRSALLLRDDRVWINADRLVVGEIRAKYDATNCDPGLPTSRQVQVAGGRRQKFAKATIYFKDGIGAHELSGDVLAYFLDRGGPSGSLGFPTSDVRKLASGATRANFEHGTVTCTPAGSCSKS